MVGSRIQIFMVFDEGVSRVRVAEALHGGRYDLALSISGFFCSWKDGASGVDPSGV